jgi:succinate-semialdehyde dehydrogenase/glutarate-semialdehyde dehydrogenase/succinate-semialdehyde dehydrogenase
MESACTSIKSFSVELGGNAPVLVYSDADLDEAVKKIVALKFANSGQVCVSPNRCFVHESIYEAFVEKAKERVNSVEMGPMISDQERSKVLGMIKLAKEQGAVVVHGGNAIEGKGYHMEPTIFRDVTLDMALPNNEIFGPILPIIKFNDNDDEIALANQSEYGLAAYVFTSNLKKAMRAAKEIDTGSVCINEPHYSVQLPHGGLKQSGVGKDCSKYSLEEYLTIKRVSILSE